MTLQPRGVTVYRAASLSHGFRPPRDTSAPNFPRPCSAALGNTSARMQVSNAHDGATVCARGQPARTQTHVQLSPMTAARCVAVGCSSRARMRVPLASGPTAAATACRGGRMRAGAPTRATPRPPVNGLEYATAVQSPSPLGRRLLTATARRSQPANSSTGSTVTDAPASQPSPTPTPSLLGLLVGLHFLVSTPIATPTDVDRFFYAPTPPTRQHQHPSKTTPTPTRRTRQRSR